MGLRSQFGMKQDPSAMQNARSRYVVRVAAREDKLKEPSLSQSPSKPSTSVDENQQQAVVNTKDPWGYAALFGVALLWGSYTPALKCA